MAQNSANYYPKIKFALKNAIHVTNTAVNTKIYKQQEDAQFMANFKHVVSQVLAEKGIEYKLKREQNIIISHLVDKSNVLAVLPTGYGKSVIYTLLPSIMDKVSAPS